MKLSSMLVFFILVMANFSVSAQIERHGDVETQLDHIQDKTDRNLGLINDNKRKIKTVAERQFSNSLDIKKLQSSDDEIKASIRINSDSIEQLGDNVQKNTSIALNNQSHIKNNVSEVVDLQKQIDDLHIKLQQRIGEMHGRQTLTASHLDRFWVLIAAALVFFMQAGFKAYEFGMVREQHARSVSVKNLVDWLIACGIFFVFGFSIMFGTTYHGWFGWNWSWFPFPTHEVLEKVGEKNIEHSLGFEFLLYQVGFAATAVTIISGAMCERTALWPYIIISVFVALIIYPVFGHWAWGGAFIANNNGWLQNMGFHDFAGSTVVHSVGAWVSLVGIWFVGPRTGRKKFPDQFNPHNLGYSVLGVFILWFGWWGFNGGSQLKYDNHVASIIMNTNLSGAFAGIAAFLDSYIRDRKNIYPKLLGSILGGLVAITASCNVVSSGEAIWIGLISGIVHNFSYDWINNSERLDDPVGAIPVHGFCGVWGTLSVGVFGYEQLGRGFWEQSLIQVIGIVSAFGFSVIMSLIIIGALNQANFLRVSPREEYDGYDIGKTN